MAGVRVAALDSHRQFPAERDSRHAQIQERPVAIDGQVVVRPDDVHRADLRSSHIDGREAVQFLVTVKQCLEDPARMVLGV